MSAGYVIARENFKEAAKHVSAETDPVMFNLIFGLQSLTNQIESDFAFLLRGSPALPKPNQKKRGAKARAKKSSPAKSKRKKARRG